MNIVRTKIKLKYKVKQNQWVIEPGKSTFNNYFQALGRLNNKSGLQGFNFCNFFK